jgi:quinolinate synthase
VFAIERLKKERKAIVLGHNYMEPALFQTVCDFKGDSLQLARQSAETDADVIVFCGVHFMAETAKILNPSKTVLIPSDRAGCSLASSITADDVRRLKALYPGVPVVTYVNTYADVKAESDICCTSSNALKVVASLDSERILFLPDEYFARNIARESGRQIIVPTNNPRSIAQKEEGLEKVLIGWPGRCEVHERFTVQDIENVRKQFPDVVILAHPECSPEVVQKSDFSGSTSAMIAYVKANPCERYLVLTECSMADNIIAENPEKDVLRLCSMRCPHMAQITLEMTQKALELNRYEVHVPEDVRIRAKRAIDRMLEIG